MMHGPTYRVFVNNSYGNDSCFLQGLWHYINDFPEPIKR